MPSNFLPETAVLIGKNFDIVPLAPDQASDYGILRQWLAEHILDLLQNNPDYLRFVLYRLDIAQSKATIAFEQSKRLDTALLLADLIIERECEKTKTRQWYKDKMAEQQNNNDNTQEYADEW
jgi:hypothetical protein